jgi:hypothetical protein
MACLSSLRLFSFLLLFFLLSGCVSFRVIAVNDGTEISPTSPELKVGETSLTEVLLLYGAPNRVMDLQGKFCLLYERAFYRGGQLTFGMPFGDAAKSPFNLSTHGNLLRHDTLALAFDSQYILREVVFEKGTARLFWDSLFVDE